MHSFTQAPVETGAGSTKATGEKVLVKAISIIVNPEGSKKAPAKTIQISPDEYPLV
jgi:hypothetical protein